MNLINDDMITALANLNIQEDDKELLIKILYNERLNKNHEWSADAVKIIKELIDAADTEDIE